MVKRFLLLVSVLTIFVTGFAFSDVPRGNVPATEATLGGIRLGNSMEYVRSIYGEPSASYWTQDYFKQKAIEYRYGNGFYIIPADPKWGGKIQEIYTTANNGISTPAGITVGVPKATVERLYGKSTFTARGAEMYTTTEGIKIGITYGRDKNGIVVVKKIHIHYEG